MHDDVLGEVRYRERVGDTGLNGRRVVVGGRGDDGVLVEEDAHGVVGLVCT